MYDFGKSSMVVGCRRRLTFNPNPSDKRSIAIPDISLTSEILPRILIFAARADSSVARVLGKSDFKILFREILPNVWGPVIVTSTMNVGWAILATAALGFIGVGAQPPHPEWGLMISEGRDYLISNWYLSTLPGTARFLAVLSLILFGDGLRDSLDPTLRHQ